MENRTLEDLRQGLLDGTLRIRHNGIDMRYRCGFPEWEEDRPCDNPNEDMTCDECPFAEEEEEW